MLCSGTESTSRSRRTTTCRSGERCMRASCSRNVAHNQPCAPCCPHHAESIPGIRPSTALAAPRLPRSDTRCVHVGRRRPCGGAMRWQRAESTYALLPQCWAYRSLTIELNGSAVHAKFPDWPANESVPIVELMQLPVKTFGWVSRGVNSSLADLVASTDGVRTNCACAAGARTRGLAWLCCSLAAI